MAKVATNLKKRQIFDARAPLAAALEAEQGQEPEAHLTSRGTALGPPNGVTGQGACMTPPRSRFAQEV